MKDNRDEGAMQHILAEQKQALLDQAVPDLVQRRFAGQGLGGNEGIEYSGLLPLRFI